MADELTKINQGIKRLVKLIETSSIVDKTALSEMRKNREFKERERDESGRFAKKEKEIQDKKSTTIDNEVNLLMDQKENVKKSFKEQWSLFKENARIFKVARAFWGSEAGAAIKNVFGRVKGLFDNVLGELGEFFNLLKDSVIDTFKFFKSSIGSIILSLRGGSKKERREKDQAKDVKDIKKIMKGEKKKSLLKPKKKESGSIFGKLLSGIFKGGGLLALLPAILPGLGIAALIGSLFMGIFRAAISFGDGNTWAQIITDGIKGFFSISRVVIGWLAKMFDTLFGSDVAKYFQKKEFEDLIDEYLGKALKVIFDFFINTAKRISEILEEGVVNWFKNFLPEILGGRKRTPEEKAAEEKIVGLQQRKAQELGNKLFSEKQSTIQSLDSTLKPSENKAEKKADARSDKQVNAINNLGKALENQSAANAEMTNMAIQNSISVQSRAQAGNSLFPAPDRDLQLNN